MTVQGADPSPLGLSMTLFLLPIFQGALSSSRFATRRCPCYLGYTPVVRPEQHCELVTSRRLAAKLLRAYVVNSAHRLHLDELPDRRKAKTSPRFGHTAAAFCLVRCVWQPRSNNQFEEKENKMRKNLLVSIVLALALLCTGFVFAQKKPVQNVSGKRHPNIAAAQRFVDQAYDKIVAAQKANEWDLGGHAQKAKELLDQVNAELKKAAEVSNEEHREERK